MTQAAPESLMDKCKRLEAFETPRWAIEAILDVELTTLNIFDPCCGLGAMAHVCDRQLLSLEQMDIEDWSKHYPCDGYGFEFTKQDFLTASVDLSQYTVLMNPPFSKACEFVDHARKLNARKIICFQRQAWRESAARRKWWEENPPARVWVCGARATCWRFDLLGTEKTEKSGSSVSMAWYVWEKAHKGAEVTSAIYPPEKRS